MTESRIRELNRLGQSVWYDNIRRGELVSGEMQRLIDLGITGLTSNPTIFEKAIGQSSDYDEALRGLVARGYADAGAIFEELAVADIQSAADLLRPVFDATRGADGHASYEVPPALAHETAGTIAEAHRLFARIARPNVMIKVPATPEGMPAIERLTADGVNVNITLIFALEAYAQVMEAYLRGLEARAARGEPLGHIASVASFFVSRIDTNVDKRLEACLASAASDAERATLRGLLGQAAIVNARLAYQAFEAVFGTERFARLAALGARLQRPLWASTSTKNPAYPDTYYVDSLVAPNTVNTLPPATIVAYNDHGSLRVAIDDDLDRAHALFGELAAVGIDMADVTRQVLDEGVAAFAKSYETLLEAIAGKRAAVAAAQAPAPVARKVPAQARPAKKAAAKKPAKKPAAKRAAKKPAAKKAAVKKVATKRAPKRPAAKKPVKKRTSG